MRSGLRQRQSGVSAIELMVGMLLGLILIGGAIAIFLASKRSYTEVEQVSALTENAQFAQRLLNNALLHAGFFGEVPHTKIYRYSAGPPRSVTNDCTGDAAAYKLQSYLIAAVADSSGKAFGCVTDAVPGTHVLVIKSVVPVPFTDGPRQSDDPAQRDGVIDTPAPLDKTKTYIMTSDKEGYIFNGASPPSTLDNVPGGVAWAYQYEVFYVRAGNTPQLSRKVLTDSPVGMLLVTEDLVEGVENIRLRFGLANTNGEVDAYTDVAAMAGNWDRVESVEVSVLVRSINQDPSYTDPKSYSMGGESISPADNFRRTLITASISLRNSKLLLRGGGA